MFICADCNISDGAIKRMMSAPEYFTLTPGEIRLCITPKYRQGHEINERMVGAIFPAALAIVNLARAALTEGIRTKAEAIRARMQYEKHRFESQDKDAAE